MENLDDLEEYINDYEHVLDELDKIMNYVTDKELKDTISYLKYTFQLEEGRRYDRANQKIEDAQEEPDEVPSNDEMRKDFINERMKELR